MNKIINTSVPIPIEHIKAYFQDKELYFYLNYADSKIKNKPFLTYMGNNGIPSDIVVDERVPEAERFQLVRDFMEVRVIIEAPALVETVAAVMLRYTGADPQGRYPRSLFNLEQMDAFIEDHPELVARWYLFLHSCLLYLIYTCQDIDAQFQVKTHHESVDDANYLGLNVCTLFALEDFYLDFIAGTRPDQLYFFTQQFEEPIYRGAKLLKYFNVPANPFYAILNGMVGEELPLDPMTGLDFIVREED